MLHPDVSVQSPDPADVALLLSLRQERILAMAKEQGFVSVDELSRCFDVTPQTIRRDVNRLCDAGLLRRYHGGAGVIGKEGDTVAATTEDGALSERISREIAREIPEHASLFLVSRRHGAAIARALAHHAGLRIVTNDLEVANILSGNPECEVILAGGLVREGRSVTGESTVSFFRQFRMDYGIIGVGGVDVDGTLFENDFLDVETTRAVLDNSRKVCLMANRDRFGRGAVVRFGNICDVDVVFTDALPSPPFSSMLCAAGVDCRVAEAEGEMPLPA